MTFDEIIEILYGEDKSLICDVLNAGGYIATLNSYIKTDAIHTGFYCRIHTGSTFEAIYSISQRMVCYKNTSLSLRLPLGTPLRFRPVGFQCKLELVDDSWIRAYDVLSEEFIPVSILGKEMKDEITKRIILDDGSEVSSFSMLNGTDKIKDYPLYPTSVCELYLGNDFKFKS